jgi:hypothetical protein
MSRISTYKFDQTVTKNDFVIGSDSTTKYTRNYKLQDLASFFGKLQSVLGDKFAYIYDQSLAFDELEKQNITFNNRTQLNTQFSGITDIYINKTNDLNVDVTPYFESLLGGSFLKINNGTKTTEYGIYRIQSVQDYNQDILLLSVFVFFSNGTKTDSDVAVISHQIAEDKHYKTALMDGDIWQIEHNLNKYPSITVVDTANNVIYGEVNYNDLNNVTITFASSVTGYAYFN